MAGPARTRGRYVDRELNAHGGHAAKRIRREAERRWSQWPKVDQRALIAHLTALEGAEHQRDAATERVVEVEAALEYDTSMGLVLLPARTAVYGAQVAAEAAQRAVEGEADWLHTFYQSHGCSRALVTAAAADLVAASLRRTAFGASVVLAQGACPARGAMGESSSGGLATRTHLGTFHDPLPVTSLTSVSPGEWQGPFNFYYRRGTLITAWILQQDGQIIDTVIRKDVEARQEWSSLRWWTDAGDFANRLPNEIAIHQALQVVPTSSQQGWSNILNLRSSNLNKRTRTYTLYMELAQYGTLYSVMEAYKASRQIIPEAFIWYIFLVLAECAVAMQHGHIPQSDDPEPTVDGWQEIVHFDIKPLNIFLTAPNPERFEEYPAPKLGDFGHAFRTYNSDPHNPELYADNGGTAPYRAPEQCVFWDNATQHPVSRYKLGAHTNVYAIAQVIRDMMVQDHRVDLSEPTDDSLEQLWPTPHARSRLVEYSDTLAGIVMKCLRYLPHQRMTALQLHAELMHHLTTAHPNTEENFILGHARDMFNNRANAAQIRVHSIYRDTANVNPNRADFRPEQGGDARFRHGLRVGPPEVNKPLDRLTKDNNVGENETIGRRDSWHRALRGQ
ncbi:hypothetical protein AMS68_002561 [Peltaster fructicola]|uniref:Protein kinase domain-containing protein n=1 Tax=Peltaster fructicola TaxID=286661 RepID=A0A6H0XQN7_9PEZI|nr:hypothetical protein AMS68_002561 [Peltaster fructicola]